MLSSTKQSIRQIDAFLDDFKYIGTLIVENDTAYLQTEDNKEITLCENHIIEIIHPDYSYHPITYQEAVSTVSSDMWSLYAGLDCRVK